MSGMYELMIGGLTQGRLTKGRLTKGRLTKVRLTTHDSRLTRLTKKTTRLLTLCTILVSSNSVYLTVVTFETLTYIDKLDIDIRHLFIS